MYKPPKSEYILSNMIKLTNFNDSLVDKNLDGWSLRNHDFSGRAKKLAEAFSFEFTLIFYKMKM